MTLTFILWHLLPIFVTLTFILWHLRFPTSPSPSAPAPSFRRLWRIVRRWASCRHERFCSLSHFLLGLHDGCRVHVLGKPFKGIAGMGTMFCASCLFEFHIIWIFISMPVPCVMQWFGMVWEWYFLTTKAVQWKTHVCIFLGLCFWGANEQLKLFYKLKGADATYSLHQVGLCPSSLAKGIQWRFCSCFQSGRDRSHWKRFLLLSGPSWRINIVCTILGMYRYQYDTEGFFLSKLGQDWNLGYTLRFQI